MNASENNATLTAIASSTREFNTKNIMLGLAGSQLKLADAQSLSEGVDETEIAPVRRTIAIFEARITQSKSKMENNAINNVSSIEEITQSIQRNISQLGTKPGIAKSLCEGYTIGLEQLGPETKEILADREKISTKLKELHTEENNILKQPKPDAARINALQKELDALMLQTTKVLQKEKPLLLKLEALEDTVTRAVRAANMTAIERQRPEGPRH